MSEARWSDTVGYCMERGIEKVFAVRLELTMTRSLSVWWTTNEPLTKGTEAEGMSESDKRMCVPFSTPLRAASEIMISSGSSYSARDCGDGTDLRSCSVVEAGHITAPWAAITKVAAASRVWGSLARAPNHWLRFRPERWRQRWGNSWCRKARAKRNL